MAGLGLRLQRDVHCGTVVSKPFPALGCCEFLPRPNLHDSQVPGLRCFQLSLKLFIQSKADNPHFCCGLATQPASRVAGAPQRVRGPCLSRALAADLVAPPPSRLVQPFARSDCPFCSSPLSYFTFHLPSPRPTELSLPAPQPPKNCSSTPLKPAHTIKLHLDDQRHRVIVDSSVPGFLCYCFNCRLQTRGPRHPFARPKVSNGVQ